MKKILGFIVLCAMGVALAGCSKDDASTSTTDAATVYTTDDGDNVLLTKAGDTSFTYDDYGRCILITDSGWNVEIGYQPFTMSGYMDDDVDEEITGSFNSAGYLSKISGSASYKEDDDYFKCTNSISFSYDSAGHLTKWVEDNSYEEKDEGEKYTEKFTGTVTFNWEDGNLVSVTTKYSGSDSEDGSWSEDGDGFEISDNDTENKYQQYTVGIGYWVMYMCVDGEFDFDVESFAHLGMLGKGPAYLPGTISSRTFSYTFNGDGTIKQEKYKNKTYNYSYTTLATKAYYEPLDTDDEMSLVNRADKHSIRSAHRSRQTLLERIRSAEE